MARIQPERYFQKVKDKYGDKVEILSEFQGKERPITICYHCEKHGDTVKVLNAKNVFDRSFNPCKECAREKKSIATTNAWKMSKEDLYIRLVEYCKSCNGRVIEKEWISAKTVYHFKCENPEHPVFESTADSLFSGKHWCPYCCGRRGKFSEQIIELIEEKGGEVVTPYVNSNTPMRVRCLKHNHKWDIAPVNLLKGKWCNVCSMSINEKTAWDWFVDNNFNVTTQYKFDDLIGENGNPYRFDFAILDNNDKLLFLIEIDDEAHRSSNKCWLDGQERDRKKNEYCLRHNIPLYRVPIERYKIAKNGYDWYYSYLDNQLNFLKEVVV